jgi:hypothetical protein
MYSLGLSTPPEALPPSLPPNCSGQGGKLHHRLGRPSEKPQLTLASTTQLGTVRRPSSAFVNRWSGFKPLIRHQQSQALTCVGSSGNFPKSQYGKTMGSKGQVEMAVVETIPLTEILGRILVSFQDAPSNALLQLQPRGQLDSALLVALHLSRKLPSGVVEHSSS